MEYIYLKNSDLKVSRFCMGGCPMGGYGWGEVSENELIEAIHIAIDSGVNLFDTADTYGLGQSEITLAKGIEGKRNDLIIQSKFGVRVEKGKTWYDNSPQYIREALEKTLQRLRTDYLDIYTIHYRDKEIPLEIVVETLDKLKDEGKIRYFGLSNICGSDMKELHMFKGKFVSCQDEFSLACRNNEKDLFVLQNELQITPMTWGSLGQGILTGKYDLNSTFEKNDRRSRDVYVNFHGEKIKKNMEIVKVLRKISEERNKSIAACAIRYILDFISESVVIAGVKRPAQLLANIEAMDWSLTEEEMMKLDRVSRNE